MNDAERVVFKDTRELLRKRESFLTSAIKGTERNLMTNKEDLSAIKKQIEDINMMLDKNDPNVGPHIAAAEQAKAVNNALSASMSENEKHVVFPAKRPDEARPFA